MKLKPWLKYLIYVLILCILIFSKEYAYGKSQNLYYRFWGGKLSYYLLILIPLLFNLLIGLALGLEHFLSERRKAGAWRFNLPRLILVGLPSLFFSMTYIIGLIDIPFITMKLLFFIRLGIEYITVFQVILGYIILSSLHKVAIIKEEESPSQASVQ